MRSSCNNTPLTLNGKLRIMPSNSYIPMSILKLVFVILSDQFSKSFTPFPHMVEMVLMPCINILLYPCVYPNHEEMSLWFSWMNTKLKNNAWEDEGFVSRVMSLIDYGWATLVLNWLHAHIKWEYLACYQEEPTLTLVWYCDASLVRLDML